MGDLERAAVDLGAEGVGGVAVSACALADSFGGVSVDVAACLFACPAAASLAFNAFF